MTRPRQIEPDVYVNTCLVRACDAIGLDARPAVPGEAPDLAIDVTFDEHPPGAPPRTERRAPPAWTPPPYVLFVPPYVAAPPQSLECARAARPSPSRSAPAVLALLGVVTFVVAFGVVVSRNPRAKAAIASRIPRIGALYASR